MNISWSDPGFKFARKLIALGTLYATCAIASLVEPKEGEFKSYVNQNLEKLIQEQEETLGIMYPKERPVIHYYIPSENTGVRGNYDPKTNEIFLLSERYEGSWWDFFTAKSTLHHELAHYYMDKLSEQLVNRDYPHFEDDMILEELIALKLIYEGIATYVERKMNGQGDSFTDNDWPKNLQGFIFHPQLPYPKNEIIYDGGFHLVKPVIDQHGEKGIKYIMFNPPKEQEMLNLPLYQQRIMEELSDQE